VTKFLFIFHMDASKQGSMSPEAREKNHAHWDVWLKEGRRLGWLVDPGDGLMPEGRVVGTKKLVTDGPFMETKEVVGGFTIVQAKTIDAAAEIAKGCPMIQDSGPGGHVEVRPLMGFALKP
jgi:hypothetical protein